MDSNLSQLLMDALTPIILAVATALAAWLTTSAKRYMDARVAMVEQGTARAILARVVDAAHVAVEATAQTFVDDLKERSKDGKLTSQDAREAASRAFNAAWGALGAEGQRVLGKVTADPARVVKDAIEAAVHHRGESRDLQDHEKEAEMEALRHTIQMLSARQ